MDILEFLIISLPCLMIAPIILSFKNRGWGPLLLAILLPPIGLIVALCLKKLDDPEDKKNNTTSLDITKSDKKSESRFTKS